MFTIKYNDLLDYIVDTHVKLADNILQYIHPDITRARRGFAASVDRALTRYVDHDPLVLQIHNEQPIKKFYDNFSAYLEGIVAEKDIELIPLSIASIKEHPTNGTHITANNWSYDQATATLRHGFGWVKYFAKYPRRWQLANDDRFTEDSKIYMLDDPDDNFKIRVTFEVLSDIVNTRNSVSNITNINMLDFTNKLQELANEISLDNIYSTAIYETY